ncbi:MAG: hypothetical protein GX808_04050 [Syntrophomonadaceae bacterium]|jgi:hypothetical protein|nr:hypothetical protein [Syntrophomonadaceae bacterium]
MSTLYNIDLGNSVNDIKSALNSNGLLGTIYYEDASHIVIDTPLVPDKVIRISINGNLYNTVQIGSSWKSGTTVNDVISLMYASTDVPTGILMVVGSDFFCFLLNRGDNPFAYIGRLENGEIIYCGLSTINGPVAGSITAGQSIAPITFRQDFRDAAGNVFAVPLMWKYNSTGQTIQNGPLPCGTPGVKVASCILTGVPYILGPNYILTNSAVRTNRSDSIYSSLLIEFS